MVLAVSLTPSEQGIEDEANVIIANMSVTNFTKQIYNLFNATQLQSLGVAICTQPFDDHICLIHFEISR